MRVRLLEAGATVYRELTTQLISLGERLARFRSTLEQLERLLAERSADDGHETPASPILAALANDTSLTTALEAELAATFLEPQGGLLELARHPTGIEEVADRLFALARGALRQKAAGVNMASLLRDRYPQPAALREALAGHLAQAVPRLDVPAPRRRLLVLLPDDPAADELQAALGELAPPGTIAVRGGPGDVVFCLEAGPRHVVPVASAVVEHRADLAAAARRVLTRCDVAWSALPLAPRPAGGASGEAAQDQPENAA